MPTPQQNFNDKILQYANDTFSTLHARFLKQIWGNNTVTAKLHKNQTETRWTKGTYECYIPTRDSTEYNLQYLRVAIQTLPENSEKTKHDEAYKLMNHISEPLGSIESELLILVAPKQDRWGLVRGFKHRNKPGYFTAVFTNKSPEIIWKRILDHIANFIQKRLDGLMRSLGFETWVWKWLQNKDNCSIIRILERFSFSIHQSALTFLKLLDQFRSKMKEVLHEIGVANMVLTHNADVLRREIKQKQSDIEYFREVLSARLKYELKFDRGLRILDALEVRCNG